MSKPTLIGLTGGIGSGKSLIAEIFKLLGIPVYNADIRARNLMNEDKILIENVKSEFGNQSYKNSTLNRQYLADRVFGSEEETAKLNRLVHPAVKIDFENWCLTQHSPYIIKEAALLFETGSYKELNKTILVITPEAKRVDRVLNRDPERSEEQIKSIMQRQLTLKEAEPLATWIIKNDESELVIPQVLRVHEEIKKEADL